MCCNLTWLLVATMTLWFTQCASRQSGERQIAEQRYFGLRFYNKLVSDPRVELGSSENERRAHHERAQEKDDERRPKSHEKPPVLV